MLREILEEINGNVLNEGKKKKVVLDIEKIFPNAAIDLERSKDADCIWELCFNGKSTSKEFAQNLEDYIISVNEILYDEGIDAPIPNKIDVKCDKIIFDDWEYLDDEDLIKLSIDEFVKEYLTDLDFDCGVGEFEIYKIK